MLVGAAGVMAVVLVVIPVVVLVQLGAQLEPMVALVVQAVLVVVMGLLVAQVMPGHKRQTLLLQALGAVAAVAVAREMVLLAVFMALVGAVVLILVVQDQVRLEL